MRKLTDYGPSIIVLATALLVLFAGPSAVRQLTYAQTRANVIQASDRLANNSILEALNQAYRDIALAVEPSVVHVSVQQLVENRWGPQQTISSGSGWVYDQQGHIVTNYHVIENAEEIEVQLDTGERRPATVVGVDKFTDIAVIKVEPGRLHPAMLADPADRVSQGDLVFAFGSPFNFRFSMSMGVVSGQGRSVGVIRNEAGRAVGYENFIQVDAAINPGNSGGPLTDYRGRVIGMNTAIATGPQQSDRGIDEGQFAGIGLAIPLDMIQPVVDQIISQGYVEKGFVGVHIDELDSPRAQRFPIRSFIGKGAVVTGIEPGGPADRAGLQPADVVTHVDGRPIASVPQMQSIITSKAPGDAIDMRVWRFDDAEGAGRTLEVHVQLDRLSTLRVAGILPADQSLDSIIELGIAKMQTATRENTAGYNLRYVPGVLIEEVVAGTHLASMMPVGSIVVQVMNRDVETVEEFVIALRQYDLRIDPFRGGGGARIEFIRPDGSRESAFLGLLPRQ